MNIQETIRDLLNARLELQDEFQVEQLCLAEDGSASATLGEKNGPVYAPILSYRITDGDSVEFSGEWQEQPMFVWEKIEVCGDILKVQCNGETKHFSISRVQKRKRHLP